MNGVIFISRQRRLPAIIAYRRERRHKAASAYTRQRLGMLLTPILEMSCDHRFSERTRQRWHHDEIAVMVRRSQALSPHANARLHFCDSGKTSKRGHPAARQQKPPASTC